MSEPVAGIELSIDLHHDLLTVRQAAELAFGATDDAEERRRNETRINVWRHRRHLLPVTDRNGVEVTNLEGAKPVFLGIDVLRCVADMKRRDPRRKGHKRRKHDDPAPRGKHDTP